MSGTPRTDAEVKRWDGTETGYNDDVPAEFARQLESELMLLQAKRIACPYCNALPHDIGPRS